MEIIIEFVKSNYLFFAIISIILILALIGYLVDYNRNKDIKVKTIDSDNISEETLD